VTFDGLVTNDEEIGEIEEFIEFDESGQFEDFDATDFSNAKRRPLPPIDDPSQLPSLRPETTQEINRIAREVSRNPYLSLYYVATIAESGGHWLNEKRAEIKADQDPPKSIAELHDAVSRTDKRGYDRHHIVEQSAAETAEKYGFPENWINGPDNLVLIPRYKHEKITAWYNTQNKEFGGVSPRKYLQGKDWREHRAMGLRAMREFGVLKP